METFVLLVAGGLVTGCIYALIAAGYAVLYTATGFVNFALGAQAMLAGYITYAGFEDVPFLFRAVVAIVASVVVSVLSWIVFYRRVSEQDMLAAVIMSFGFSIVLAEVVQLVAGGVPLPARSPVGSGRHELGPLSISSHSILVLVVSALLFALLATVMSSRGGATVRAMFQDREMAETLGVATNRMTIVLFAASGVFAGAAGILTAPILSLSPHMGTRLALIAFVGAILGGLGSIRSAIVGAIILGMLEAFFAGYISPDWRATLVFGVFVVILVLKPAGVLGRVAAVKV
ncbi:branched-chain amino acid ABC transporter permease [Nocardioides caldifontis]|uniref:branched-chain amino acid ABC transporter permease n=1 Tax=Nocardioides caldifontis TaxID=2588938 RepID=UPI0011E01552|nr:branched-chain amino acid ABC transporter permease [Nocardioides caldifontis]